MPKRVLTDDGLARRVCDASRWPPSPAAHARRRRTDAAAAEAGEAPKPKTYQEVEPEVAAEAPVEEAERVGSQLPSAPLTRAASRDHAADAIRAIVVAADVADHRGGRAVAVARSRTQPTITDLLREGQEILVQIAKEPIAKKGARITSHIALPGRFLVYMPTVEHVGVSRKIESDSERQRLRKLITLIRGTEDIPSGGFIVRTAGVGISEADLREDVRYLVRTWLDIRASAEKAKPATMVHKDLDLVQRILRDQLSDDFAAIRVDSEEEYEAHRRVHESHSAAHGKTREALHARPADSRKLRRAG